MKNISKLLVLALITVSLIGCNKGDDSDDATMTNAPLTGTWHFVNSTTNGVVDPTEPCQEFFAVTFRDNLTITIFERTGTNCETSTQQQGTYTRNGNTLTVVAPTTVTGEILTLTSNALSIQFMEGTDVSVENYSR